MRKELFVLTMRHLNSLFKEGKLDDEKINELATFSIKLGSQKESFKNAAKVSDTREILEIIQSIDKQSSVAASRM